MLLVISIVNFLGAFTIYTDNHNGLMSMNILSLVYSAGYLFNPRFSKNFRNRAGMQVIKNVILILLLLFYKSIENSNDKPQQPKQLQLYEGKIQKIDSVKKTSCDSKDTFFYPNTDNENLVTLNQLQVSFSKEFSENNDRKSSSEQDYWDHIQ